jgi:uncharacterized membrane protein YkoI
MKHAILLSFALLACGASSPGLAREDRPRQQRDDSRRDEHDLAREALRRGDVLPIARILAVVAQRVPGEIVEVKLDERRGQLFYQVKVLTAAGIVREVHLDPRTAAITREEDD